MAVWWWQRLARNRFLATIRTMAEPGRNVIGGQSVEHWLEILNRDTARSLVAIDTLVLMYKGREWFFVNGGIFCRIPETNRVTYRTAKACFLVAVGETAVRLLAEQERVFRRIAGSADLAAFSIFRWPDFVAMLMAEKRR